MTVPLGSTLIHAREDSVFTRNSPMATPPSAAATNHAEARRGRVASDPSLISLQVFQGGNLTCMPVPLAEQFLEKLVGDR